MKAALFAPLVPLALAIRLSAPTDACDLLTQAQVTAALGVPVAAGTHIIPQNKLVCGWAPSAGPTIGGKKVTVTIMSQQSFMNGKIPMGHIVKEPVSGIGDDAYYVTTPGFGTDVNVKKGTFFFQIRVGGFSTDKEKSVEKTLANNIIAKL